MWGTDMTQTITIREGRANVFVAVEHANSEVVGIYASRYHFEALERERGRRAGHPAPAYRPPMT
jgi:hypothetical protein